jgi:hypothetical protein
MIIFWMLTAQQDGIENLIEIRHVYGHELTVPANRSHDRTDSEKSRNLVAGCLVKCKGLITDL